MISLLTLNDPHGMATKFLKTIEARVGELGQTLQSLFASSDDEKQSVEEEVIQIEEAYYSDDVQGDDPEASSSVSFVSIDSKHLQSEPLIAHSLTTIEGSIHQFVEFSNLKKGNYKKICRHHDEYTEVWRAEFLTFKPFFSNHFDQEHKNLGQVAWSCKSIIRSSSS